MDLKKGLILKRDGFEGWWIKRKILKRDGLRRRKVLKKGWIKKRDLKESFKRKILKDGF